MPQNNGVLSVRPGFLSVTGIAVASDGGYSVVSTNHTASVPLEMDRAPSSVLAKVA